MNTVYDLIIIGGGPAGYSAALYASRAWLTTLVIEKMAAGGQMAVTDSIDNYPGFEDGIEGFALGMKMQAGAERFGAKTEYAEVLSVDFSSKIKTVRTAESDFRSYAVVIAAGANPKPMGIAGEESLIGKGLHYCAHCDGRFYQGKTVMVVGGGNSAVSDALYLSHLAEKVILVHRRDTLRAAKIYHAPLMKKENVEVVWNSTVSSFLENGRLLGARLKNLVSGEEHDRLCDGIFVSIGRKPATDFLNRQVALDEHGYVVADETTKTNIEGVFAVGDIRTKVLRQVVTAVADGAVAAHFTEEYLASLGTVKTQ